MRSYQEGKKVQTGAGFQEEKEWAAEEAKSCSVDQPVWDGASRKIGFDGPMQCKGINSF